jgi:hypothetical protein
MGEARLPALLESTVQGDETMTKPIIPECCKTCRKRITINGKGKQDCSVLTNLGAWGPNCTAQTNDPGWREKVRTAVEKYREDHE